jgi:tellurite resistance protein
MTKILNPSHLEFDQMRAILQAMLRVARADGENEPELALIRQYYDACRSEVKSLTSFEELRRAAYDVKLAEAAVTDHELKQSLLGSCLLIAYADGQVSPPEQATIGELIREFDIDDETVATAHERIKALLLQQLSRISDLQTLQKLAGAH